ncbi:peptidoglycan-binding domain-containing protein [Streptomyces sp. VNUA116]|uniref:peptidoglycan-binding domain-containing protein n=1 Tax=Streptomyces sp. VNUA116 TaxID=3062449 RepID=UPI0026756547|nr:peptidoglycan-binding domain-containing protein [Streptomyces sp. VNUA116]WKU46733.1 peptidoglycan-binding domain-containing protein [Streptomyces sp. VNUA116]
MASQTYPLASTSQWFEDDYPGSPMTVNTGVIHTTETTGWPDYDDGASAPTMTARPDFDDEKLVFRQHFPINKSARALVNAPGGVQTNTLNCFQIELTGTCDPDTHEEWKDSGYAHIFWPEAPEWALRDLAKLFAWLADEHDIPLTSDVEFLSYPDSYGSASGQRMSFSEWNNYSGWAGHQHVPENDHGDPGSFPIKKVLAYAKGANVPDEDDEPSSSIVSLASGVKPGATHPQVRELQQLLIAAGYGPIKGAVTTYYGVNTQEAVARFHDANPKLKTTGVSRDTAIGQAGFVELQKEAGRR